MIWRIIFVIVFALFFIGVGITVLLRLPPALGLLWVIGLGGAFLWWHARRDHPRRRALVRLRRPRGSPGLIVVASASTLLVAFGTAGLIDMFAAPFHDIDLAPWERIAAYMDSIGGWIAMTAFVALVAPIVEEFCFRGHIQHSLERRYAPWVAILVTTALFTAAHISPAHPSILLIPLVLGLGTGAVTVLFQSIWVAVIIHGVWNAAMSIQSALPENTPGVLGHDWRIQLMLVPLALGLAGWFLVLRDVRYRTLLS